MFTQAIQYKQKMGLKPINLPPNSKGINFNKVQQEMKDLLRIVRLESVHAHGTIEVNSRLKKEKGKK